MTRHTMPRFLAAFLLCLILPAGSFGVRAQQARVNLDWNPQKNTEQLVPFGAELISPEVHNDRTVTFRVRAPLAQQVALAPGPLTAALGRGYEPVPFEKDDEDVWTLTAGPIAPDLYVYRLLIDSVAVADPNNTLAGTAVQPPYSELVIPGNGPAYYDARPVPHGAVTRHIYHSDVTGGARDLYVYTPPGYDAARPYPVLYLMGGSGELASNWALEGRVNFVMDNLLAEDAVVPMLIAMPNNQVLHRSHPDHEQLTFDLLEAELRGHVVPFVDAHYNTRPEPAGRALAGLSMGGRHAQFVGFESLDLFGSFGVLSAGHPDTETLSADFLNDPGVNEKVDYLFVGLGGAEAQPGHPMGARSEALRAALEAHGIEHEYYVGGDGGHDWGTWRHLLHARFLPGLWRNE